MLDQIKSATIDQSGEEVDSDTNLQKKVIVTSLEACLGVDFIFAGHGKAHVVMTYTPDPIEVLQAMGRSVRGKDQSLKPSMEILSPDPMNIGPFINQLTHERKHYYLVPQDHHLSLETIQEQRLFTKTVEGTVKCLNAGHNYEQLLQQFPKPNQIMAPKRKRLRQLGDEEELEKTIN